MRPCVGIPECVPPLCRWSELEDGTYTITDVYRFNLAMDEMIQLKRQAIEYAQRN